jgi:hypothetical protein
LLHSLVVLGFTAAHRFGFGPLGLRSTAYQKKAVEV